MQKVLGLVEGPTEERFIKEIVSPHLQQHGVAIIPTIAVTKRVKAGPDFKGGIVSYVKVRNDLLKLLLDSSAACVTTMFDLYGLPLDFPGCRTASGPPYDKVKVIEQAFEKEINHPRFLAHLTLHEFEGLLFTAPAKIAQALNEPQKEDALIAIRDCFRTPEEINDDPRTAPSKRIINLFPHYGKVLHGSIIAQRIGLDTIRAECPHFNEWLTKLEHVR